VCLSRRSRRIRSHNKDVGVAVCVAVCVAMLLCVPDKGKLPE